jgi:hypothetical protein
MLLVEEPVLAEPTGPLDVQLFPLPPVPVKFHVIAPEGVAPLVAPKTDAVNVIVEPSVAVVELP